MTQVSCPIFLYFRLSVIISTIRIDAECDGRQQTRQLEIEACSKVLAVLGLDDAHDLFTKTFHPAFVQKESVAQSERRNKAYASLAQNARRVGNPRPSNLASQVKLDAFMKATQAIDDMVAQLLPEKVGEIKRKDFCVIRCKQVTRIVTKKIS